MHETPGFNLSFGVADGHIYSHHGGPRFEFGAPMIWPSASGVTAEDNKDWVFTSADCKCRTQI